MSTLTEQFNILVRHLKRQFFESISQETEVFVAINMEALEANVPDHLHKTEGSLTLKFSPRYGPLLEILEEGVKQTLVFQGEQYDVFVSWDAIWAIREESGRKEKVWGWHAPKGVRTEQPVQVQLGDMDVVISPGGEVDFPSYIH